MMGHIQQQLDQGIHDLLPPAPTVGGEQREADGIRMAAHLLEFLDGNAVAVALQRPGRDMSEQIRWQAQLVKTLQLVDFLQHTLQAEGTDILFERVQG